MIQRHWVFVEINKTKNKKEKKKPRNVSKATDVSNRQGSPRKRPCVVGCMGNQTHKKKGGEWGRICSDVTAFADRKSGLSRCRHCWL